LTSGAALNINTSGDTHIKAANTAIDGGNINLNSGTASGTPTATTATPPDPLSTFDNPTETDGTTITSIMLRIPTTEPYPHHENLDPTTFKPDQTDRESGSAIAVPNAWKTYSTATDTFTKNQG
jgi:hypothetical protein